MADLTLTPLYFDNTEVDASELRQPWSDVVFPGVSRPYDFIVLPKGGSVVSPDAGGGARNLSVDILTGRGWIAGDDSPATQGFYRAYQPSTVNETITANASGSTRIDTVILEIVPGSSLGRTRVVAGTPGGGAPALPNNAEALANVSVSSGTTAITAANITDRRTRIISPTTTGVPTGNVSLAGSAWTTLVTMPAVTLPRDARVRLRGRARFVSSGAGRPQIGLAFFLGSVGLDHTGFKTMPGTGDNATGAYGMEDSLRLDYEADFLGGIAHTFSMAGWKDGNGTVTVSGTSQTVGSFAAYTTRMYVEVAG